MNTQELYDVRSKFKKEIKNITVQSNFFINKTNVTQRGKKVKKKVWAYLTILAPNPKIA